MGKKNEVPWTTGEKIMVFNIVTGGVCMLATVVPQIPWRYALAQSSMTQRFGMDRRYSLLHIGDNLGMGMSWLKLRKDVCRKQEEFNRVDPISGIMGAASGMMGTGGAIVGCQGWPSCKQHVSQRCMAYSTMAIVGLVCTLFQLASCSAAFAFPVMLGKEAEFAKKKKKKLDAAKFKTMICGIVAGVCGFLSWSTWTVLSAMTFKDLASKSAYPFPSAHIGIYLAGFGVLLLSIAFFQCIYRVYKSEDGGEDEEDEVIEEYAEADVGAAVLMPGEPLEQPASFHAQG